MAFIKGQSGNPKGRAKGSQNKSTVELKQFFKNLLEENQEQIKEDLANVEAKDRLRFFIELSAYVLPRQTAASVQASVESQTSISLYQRLDELSQPEQIDAGDAALLGDGDLPSDVQEFDNGSSYC